MSAGVSHAGAATGDERIGWPVWRLALVIVFGAFMSGLDTSVVNVGVDAIAADLDADLSQVQWVSNAYLLALAVSLPVCGWLGRRIGVGRLWLAALVAFTVASGLCALAGTVQWLIAARVVQGLAGGLLVPAGQTLLGQAVGPGRLGRVMATLGLAVSLAPALGPVVGGIVVDGGSWPWLFAVNLPLGAVGLLLGWRYVPRGEPGTAERLDVAGLGLLAVGLPLIVYGVTTWGETTRLTTAAAVPSVTGGLAVVLFVAHSRRRVRRERPALLDLRLFGDRGYRAAVVASAATGVVLFGSGLLYPLYFQLGRGLDPLAAGVALVSTSIGTAAVMPLAGRLVDRLGGGPTCVLGCGLALVTTAPFALLPLEAPSPLVQVLLLVRGAAVGLAAMPASTAAYKAVRAEQLPDATTQVTIAQRLGGALGGALFAVVLATRLPAGVDEAFAVTFWWLTGATALSLAGAVWLARAQRALRP